MERIAIETHYLDSCDLAELTNLVRGWAQLITLPSRTTEEIAYREILQAASIVIGSPRPSWVVGTKINLIQLAGAGYEDYVGIGLDAQANLTLCNARGVFSLGIAEHTIALMLAFCRNLPHYFAAQQSKQWAPQYDNFPELTGQTLVIVGLGSIGCEIAKRAFGLGMRVLGVRRNTSDPLPAGVEQVLSMQQLPQMLKLADHVAVALPGGKTTRHLINSDMLSQIKKGAFLYNVGRGNSVDESALIAALNSGRLSGVGLDVFEQEPIPFDSPLWRMPQVIITPHIAGYSQNSKKRFGRLVIENLQRHHAGLSLLNKISLSELSGTNQ